MNSHKNSHTAVKIIAYEVATGADGYSLARLVNRMIGEGWQPYGSVCRNGPKQSLHGLLQPMVKFDDSPRPLRKLSALPDDRGEMRYADTAPEARAAA